MTTLTEDGHVSSSPCLLLLVLVGGEVNVQIYFMCGLEVKLVLKCFCINKQLYTGKPESVVQVNRFYKQDVKHVNPVCQMHIYKGTFAQRLL